MESQKRTVAFRQVLNEAFPQIAAKQEVRKSASRLIDGIASIRDRNGRLLGFGTCEQVDYTKIKQDISKAVSDTVHENDLLDDLFDFLNDDRVEVQKSADSEEFEPEIEFDSKGCFPSWLA
ncbi:MAG: hypothetical protein COA78_32470 [Blastopirellula sp.]|nr:MAG: hypothetical protein COA78_32470 [Blastopirellula sp.]